MARKGVIDGDAIRELAELLTETGLTEIEIADGDSRIRVARTTQASFALPARPTAPQQPDEPDKAEATPAATDHANHPGVVRSPMVGTAFRAPEPGARPFVDVGDEVREGQTLMIVEAMKTMNQIPCPRAGRVASILIEDGQPVEYDEPLLIVE